VRGVTHVCGDRFRFRIGPESMHSPVVPPLTQPRHGAEPSWTHLTFEFLLIVISAPIIKRSNHVSRDPLRCLVRSSASRHADLPTPRASNRSSNHRTETLALSERKERGFRLYEERAEELRLSGLIISFYVMIQSRYRWGRVHPSLSVYTIC
jgi:hypothetical protein